jgi:hypothetical protein
MNLISDSCFVSYLLGFLSLTLSVHSGTAVSGEQRSRSELLKDAGRLATAAERMQDKNQVIEDHKTGLWPCRKHLPLRSRNKRQSFYQSSYNG